MAIKYNICPSNPNKIDIYDDEKLLFCESNKMEYYKT